MSAELGRKSNLLVNSETFLRWRSLCVYAWRRGDKYLYVGFSGNGLQRPLNHTVIGIVEDVQPQDTIEVWFFSEDERDERGRTDALLFEERMILEHRPKYNIVGNPSHEKNIRLYNRWKNYYYPPKPEESDGWSERSEWTGELPL